MSIKKVQMKLATAGFNPGVIDGLWGPRTEDALDALILAAKPAQVSADLDQMIVAELRRDEGEALYAYTDSEGYLTIGVGRLIDRRKGGGITEAESAYLLANDLREKVADLDEYLPWWRQLSPVRQRVLLNMCFNLGIGGLMGFENTLKAVREGRYNDAAQGMLDSLWARQVKGRANRLAEMMRTGRA